MPVPIATQQIPTDLVTKTTRELSVPAGTCLRARRALPGTSHRAVRAPGAASSADGGSGVLAEPVPSSRSISKSVAEGRVLLVLQTSPTSLFHVPRFVEVRVMTLTYLGIKDKPPVFVSWSLCAEVPQSGKVGAPGHVTVRLQGAPAPLLLANWQVQLSGGAQWGEARLPGVPLASSHGPLHAQPLRAVSHRAFKRPLRAAALRGKRQHWRWCEALQPYQPRMRPCPQPAPSSLISVSPPPAPS